MTVATAGKLPEFMGMPVELRDVERELSSQMKVEQGKDVAPVQRVRMSNLVIYCGNLALAEAVAEQVPDVVTVHPARVLLLVADAGAPPGITAGVNVRRRVIDKELHLCSEQVTLRAPEGMVERLPFAVRALLIGDLPTNLWWATPQPPPMAGPLLLELAETAQQIMYDSIGWPQPALGVAATAAWLESIERTESLRWRVASDLNWRRLKYWRRMVAQALDPGSHPGAAESLTEIQLEHGPHAVVQAWELASWLTTRLGWKVQAGKSHDNVEMVWRFIGPKGDTRVRIRRLDSGPAEIRRLRLVVTLDGKPGALNIVAEDSVRLAIQLEGVEGAPRTMALPNHPAAELVGRQLSDRERDPVFHESMAVARVMAKSVLT
jgi:glucose-6-phosphate dehydrogenase assembly protein OpcA